MAQASWLGIVALLIPSSSAFGQSAGPHPDLGLGAGIADRPRPEYAPVGGRIGSFFVYPEFGLSSTATDNLLATQENRRSDLETILASKVSLRSGFTRNAVDIAVHFNQSLHINQTSENASRYGLLAKGRYDLDAGTWISASAAIDREVEPRSSFNSPSGAAEPSRFDRYGFRTSAQRPIGPFTVGLDASFVRFRFFDVLANGTRMSQRYRDNDSLSGTLSFGYEFRPGIHVITRTTVDHVSYPLTVSNPHQPAPLDRNSSGVRVEAGLRFELTSLLTGEARIGYLRRSYISPQLRDSSGPSFGADLLWNVTQLTSLRFSADRRVDEAASATVAGNQTSEFGLAADHEFRRNAIVSVGLRHIAITPLGTSPSSREIQAEAGARLLVSRRVSVRVGYRFADRQSKSLEHAYRENRASVGLLITL